MNELIESRFIVQTGSLINACLFLVLIVVIVRTKIFDWRFLVFPLLILPQRIFFYGYVILMQPTPSGLLTFWSALITFEEITAGLIVVFLLSWPQLKTKCANVYRNRKKDV